ncbi:MAG: hypothetical protein JSS86_13590 [Cyanobacteria bacterium SZAS LIN-2]|nr:hypothetical protein [Cyanobacteria bacterium SZAS LIN-2]
MAGAVYSVFSTAPKEMLGEMMGKKYLMLIVIVSTFFLQGCGDTTLQRLSGDLATAGGGCSLRVAKFYDHLNDAHRDMYGKELKVEPEANLPPDLQERQRSGLIDKHSADYISLRVQTAKLIESYCTQINGVANAKSNSQADQMVTGLNSQLQVILTNITKLPNMPAWPVGSLNSLAAPVSSLAGMGVKGAVGFMKTNWVKDVVRKSDKDVEAVCDRMKIDLDNDAGEAKQRASRLVGLYKRRFDLKLKEQPSSEERDRLLADLQAMGKYQSDVANDNPSADFEKVKETYHALASWAAEEHPISNWRPWRKP